MKPSKRTIRREKKKKNEEEIQKIKIATTHESYDVPHDLIPDILSRLPARSMARFRAVSRQWYFMTTSPDFIKSFESRSSPSLLLTFQSNMSSTWELNRGLTLSFDSRELVQVVYSFPQTDGSNSYDVYQMTNASEYWKKLQAGHSQSVHGLVLLRGFVIWNPTTRQFFTLPKPTETYGYTYRDTYLGYDPVEGKHKVVHLSKQPQVLTLGAKESWRVITQGTLHHDSSWGSSRGRCFNGTLYYDSHECLRSFDVRSEKFNPPIKHPDYTMGYMYVSGFDGEVAECPLLIPYEGSLALVSPIISPDDNKVYLSVLEDADGHEWTLKCFILPSHGPKTESRTFHGVTDAGELIFVSRLASPYSSFHISYFDPRSNSIRDSLFEGINERGRHIFPNHIECLFSM